jgi:hypothetical protein
MKQIDGIADPVRRLCWHGAIMASERQQRSGCAGGQRVSLPPNGEETQCGAPVLWW